MATPIHILLLEDNASDAELVRRELRKAGLDFTSEWAPDKGSFLQALESFAPDIVLVDYLLPGFDGLTALALARERFAEIPVIVVSGAVGEEVAVETLKAGATDYVLKDRLRRLGPAVRRALQEAERRVEKKRAEAALREAHERLRLQAEELQTVNEELRAQAEELQAANEEFQAQREELQNQAGELASANQDLRGSQQALRDREEELRLIMDTGPTLISYVDADGRYRRVNQTYEQWFGCATEEVRGRHVRDVQGEAVWQILKPYVERALAGEMVTYEQQLPLWNGESRWVYASYTPDRDESGRVRGFVAHTVDIGEQKRAQTALRELARTLEARVAQRTQQLERRARQLQKLTLELSQAEDRERKRLAEILHDDLQQQLAAAKFHVGLIASRVRDEVSVQKAAGQIGEMLMQAIQTSRSLSHELSPAILYHGGLGETFEWLAGQIQTQHGLVVRVHAQGEIDSQSDALKAFLYKAAQEMLFNVVKHARASEATLRLRRAGGCICLAVSDRGRGFDPRQLRATTGFGLFSIRERVHLLGGRMKIRSTPGKGSTFFIAVPEATEEGENVRTREGEKGRTDEGAKFSHSDLATFPPSQVAGGHLRVLVADDHEVVRQGLVALLREQPDVEVVGEATNGRETVDLAYRFEPDVVIIDVAMPLMNGDEAARQILRHLPRTRIVALSMHEEAGTVDRMRQAGAAAYILKTAPYNELLAAVRGTP